MEKQLTDEIQLNKKSDRIFYIWVIIFGILFSPAFYMILTNDGVPKNVSIERAINSLGKLNDFDTLVEYPTNKTPVK